ncbi:MAG TPA: heparinase II/III family protein [Mariniphaga sp.]|nr:heparinase II/III family protein [Mariniphaga sp.]
MKYIFLFLFSIQIFGLNCNAQAGFPHILVNNSEKEAVLEKIQEQAWAQKIYEEHYTKVKPYVERHQNDPEWILSRYLMNRVEGKRYTHAYDNGNGHYLVNYSGDAPVPTVRVSTHKRNPVTESGASYIRPSIEELVPYDTASYIWALNTETNQKDFIDPQQFVSTINGEINNLALSAAVIYWLEGDEKYARFAADILDQWAHGASYQEPIVGACRTGFLDIQTLGDNRYQSLILAYDFVYPFLKKEGYELSYYQNVFEKFASTLTFRGFWNNNWYAAVSSTLVYAALSLDDKDKRDYYLQFVLERDTINGSCGHLSLASTVENWLTHDGHWKEPGGYHNFPVSNLVNAAYALEKNGYSVFKRFPELFSATYAMLKYSFPNMLVSAFGDTGRAFQSPQTVETGLAIAAKYNWPELPNMMAAMKTLLEHGMHDRSKSGIFGLLTFLPEFPETENVTYTWPRSGELEFARFYLQRNGSDVNHGLMYGVQGASYNHNHCNGMSMELYGSGEVMGIDAGTGPNYEHPLHQNYFSQWAAHNTVVAAGSSSSVPFSGGAGRKNIGQVELAAMEPMPDEKAVSPFYSFTDTRYFDHSTNTNQLRTMAIVRTSDSTGYYVDIYRSDNEVSNDYVYHNIGDKFEFLDKNNHPIAMKPGQYPLTGKDKPGFRFYSEVEKLEGYEESMRGVFSARDRNENDIYMNAIVPALQNKTYYKAKSLPVKTAGSHYNDIPMPLFTIRAEREAWSDPFVVVFEPSFTKDKNSVQSVEKMKDFSDENTTVLRVKHNDGSYQLIFQGNSTEVNIKDKDWSFSGHFGVVSFDDEGQLERMYLGEGKHITYKHLKLESIDGTASAELKFNISNDYSLSATGPVKFELNGSVVRVLK